MKPKPISRNQWFAIIAMWATFLFVAMDTAHAFNIPPALAFAGGTFAGTVIGFVSALLVVT